MTDQKESIDPIVTIEENQKATIGSHKNWDREQERKSKWKEKRGSDDKKK